MKTKHQWKSSNKLTKQVMHLRCKLSTTHTQHPCETIERQSRLLNGQFICKRCPFVLAIIFGKQQFSSSVHLRWNFLITFTPGNACQSQIHNLFKLCFLEECMWVCFMVNIGYNTFLPPAVTVDTVAGHVTKRYNVTYFNVVALSHLIYSTFEMMAFDVHARGWESQKISITTSTTVGAEHPRWCVLNFRLLTLTIADVTIIRKWTITRKKQERTRKKESKMFFFWLENVLSVCFVLLFALVYPNMNNIPKKWNEWYEVDQLHMIDTF